MIEPIPWGLRNYLRIEFPNRSFVEVSYRTMNGNARALALR
jgi:hypothetical protein